MCILHIYWTEQVRQHAQAKKWTPEVCVAKLDESFHKGTLTTERLMTLHDYSSPGSNATRIASNSNILQNLCTHLGVQYARSSARPKKLNTAEMREAIVDKMNSRP